jgi:hypothetical protein
MSHHPDKIKNPARMHLSYAPFGTLKVVGLDRKDPASNGAPSQLAGWGSEAGSFAIEGANRRSLSF